MSDQIVFLLLILSMVGTPGPATISAFASGVQFGFVKSLNYIFGLITGFATVIVISHYGFISVIIQDPFIFDTFLVFTFIYLIYLALKIWYSEIDETQKANLFFFDGFVLNVMNPKAYIGIMTIYTQFHDRIDSIWIGLSTWIIGSSIACLYAFTGQWIGRRTDRNHLILLNRTLSVVLMVTIIILFV